MKKFFALFAFVLLTALVSFAPQASADIHIDFSQVEFFPTDRKVRFHAKMFNTINKPVVVKKIDVRLISIYDAEKNLIWSNAATFENINVPVPANGEIEIPITIHDAPDVPAYEGAISTEDDTWIEWEITE